MDDISMFVQISVSASGTENLGPHWVEVADRATAHRQLDETIDKWEELFPERRRSSTT